MQSILLVDDDPEFLAFVAEALRRRGYRVLTAGDGRQGLETLEREAVDIVLTDVFMPEVDGIELIMSVRKTHPDLPIIAMTGGYGGATSPYMSSVVHLGATVALEKPFTADVLQDVIAEIGQRRSRVTP